MDNDSKKWYCTLPWDGFSNDPDGKVRPCCLYKEHIKDEEGQFMYVQTHTVHEIFHSKFMKDLRQQFRRGEKPAGCSVCILDEENGHRSKRQIYYRHPSNPSYSKDRAINFEDEPKYPTEFQMILSNACNLKCRSCTPSHSNLWQAEHKIIWGNTGYSMPHGQSGDKNGVLWKNRHEWMQHLQVLEVVGGEPFYIDQWKILWDELISNGYSKNIRVSSSSNAAIYAADVLEKLCNNFKLVGLGLSIDGMGKTYNYLRHPANWELVSQNIINYSNWRKDKNINNLDISISHTIGWLNAFWIPEFKHWLNANTYKFNFWYNIIHNPQHMALWAIPKPVKTLIEEKLINWVQNSAPNDKSHVQGLIKFMYSKQLSDDELKQLYKKFLVNDKLRDENILDVIPKDFTTYMAHLF